MVGTIVVTGQADELRQSLLAAGGLFGEPIKLIRSLLRQKTVNRNDDFEVNCQTN